MNYEQERKRFDAWWQKTGRSHYDELMRGLAWAAWREAVNPCHGGSTAQPTEGTSAGHSEPKA